MPPLIIARPDLSEYAPYYGRYIDLIKESDILRLLTAQIDTTVEFLRTIPASSGDFRYADGKWSVKEVLGHMIDTERVFAYRALSIARNDPASLPGFEQDDWVRAAVFGAQPLSQLVSEFEFVRRADIFFFHHLTLEAWSRRGVASGCEFTVRALAYVIAGHERHHVQILQTRYKLDI
jgi:hypothetical protein